MKIFEAVLKSIEEKASFEFENDDFFISVDYDDEFDEVSINIDYNGEMGAGVYISRTKTEKEISEAIEDFFPEEDKDFNFKKVI